MGGVGSGNLGIYANGLALKIDSTSQTVTIPKNINMNNQSQNKMLALYDGGVATDQTRHDYIGLGNSFRNFRFHSVDTLTDFAYFAATSATASNELFRIKGTGLVQMTGRLEIGSFGNIGIGPNALAANTTGINNVAVGSAALM